METLLAWLHGAAFATTAFALPYPRVRRPALALLGVALLASVAFGLATPGERTLITVHTFAGFEGIDQEVSMRSFPTGSATAAGWLWPLPFAGFAAGWILFLMRAGTTALRRPWLTPLWLAWSATAAWLGMQALAAPAAVVQPLGLDRFLYPAGLGLALGMAERAATFRALLFSISAGILAARLPVAFASKLCTDLRLGTSLDVTLVGTTAEGNIVNPMSGLQLEGLVAGSGLQQFWLIWLEHVIIFPAIYWLSCLGIALCAHLYHKHGSQA